MKTQNTFAFVVVGLVLVGGACFAGSSRRVSAEELTLVSENVGQLDESSMGTGRGTGRGIGNGHGRGIGNGRRASIGVTSYKSVTLPSPSVDLRG